MPPATALPTDPALSYKVGIPQVADHIRRDALMEELAENHRRTPISWVVGLPGSGKTSLVARFIAERGVRAIGYRLDAEDADGAAWVDAIGKAPHESTDILPKWSPENQAELADFARPFFAALGRSKLTLVLDDCHRVPDDSPILSMLAHVHEVAGEDLRIIVISRREPPPHLARGVMGGWLSVVDELRLTENEVAEIAHAIGGKNFRADAQVLAAADGWLAHVLALCRRPTSATALAGNTGARVGDFLAAELLASVPKKDRAGLRRLAELPEIPARAANAKWMSPEVERLLATLSAQRYFVDAIGGHYRLHDLLRDALLRRNVEEESAVTLAEARRELAEWIGSQMPEAAMQLRALAHDTVGALDLLARHGSTWLARGLHRTVLGWIHDLPEPNATRDRALYAYWRAQALLPLEPEASRPLFATCRNIAIEIGATELAYTAWCGEVESFVIQWGAVHGLADLVDDLEQLHSRVGPPSEDLSFRTSAAALTALMYGRAEDPRLAHFAEATARAVTHASNAGTRIAAAAQLLIYKMWWSGDFPGGRALYETFDAEVSEGEHLDPLPRLLWWSCASIVDWQCGSPDECHRKVERGLALAASSGVHVRDFFLLTQGIFCALNREDWSRAEKYLEQLARTERTHRRLDVMVHHFFRSWYGLSRGDSRTALAHAETAWPIAEAIGSTFHKVIVLSALGPARVCTGDLAGASAVYREQIALAKASRNPTFSFIAFCMGAEIALAANDDAGLAKQVERMLLVKSLGEFHSCCGWRTPLMQQLLAFALSRGISPEIARTWIRERKIPPPDSPPPEGWPMPVIIEGRNGLTVLLDGREASEGASGKSAKRLRELIAVLAVSKDGATQEQLCDWLWPDSDGDRAQASLKVAIHRARQWLGNETIRVHEGRVMLDPKIAVSDLWSLQRMSPSKIQSDEKELDSQRILAGFDAPPIRALRALFQGRLK